MTSGRGCRAARGVVDGISLGFGTLKLSTLSMLLIA